MRTFEEVKEELLYLAEKAGRRPADNRIYLEAKSKTDLLRAITAEWQWVFVSAKMIDAKYLESNFTEEELSKVNIYVRGSHETHVSAFALGSATVEACDNATVRAYNSATVEACDNATVRAYNSATVEAYDNATVSAHDSATVEAYDNATVIACDSATVEAYDNATVIACDSATVEAYDNAIVKAYNNATVEACDSAIVRAYDNATVEAYEESYIEDFTKNIRPEGGYAIVKDYYNSKIYIKKGKFEIIEIE